MLRMGAAWFCSGSEGGRGAAETLLIQQPEQDVCWCAVVGQQLEGPQTRYGATLVLVAHKEEQCKVTGVATSLGQQ